MRNTKDGTVALFNRGRSKSRTEDDLVPVDTDEATPEADAAEDSDAQSPDLARSGPFDRGDVTDDSEHLNLGSIWLKGVTGMEVRLEVNEQEQQITGVTAVLGDSAVQLQAFAAPRTEGVWVDIRNEIAKTITDAGGTAEVVSGRAAIEPEAAEPIHEVIRTAVIDRGSEAMPPRELLPLQLPQAAESGEPTEAEAGQTSVEDLKPFERGPEITEVR
jgi:hypothetical protein